MEYGLHLLVLIALYGALATSLDLVAGHAGRITLSQAAFYGLGAYASALLAVRAGWPFLAGALVGVIVAAVLSLCVSIPSLRLRDDAFVLATFAFQMIVFSVLNNWTELTRGPLGIPGIPRPRILGWRADSTGELALLAAGILILTRLVVSRLAGSPFGRVLRALRENESWAQALGKDTLRCKASAFAVSAGLAALAGSLWAHYVTYVDPFGFTFMESVLILSMVVLGGAASSWGPLIGAAMLVLLPEALRLLGLSNAAAANLRQIAYGLLLVLMMRFRPRGLAGRYELR